MHFSRTFRRRMLLSVLAFICLIIALQVFVNGAIERILTGSSLSNLIFTTHGTLGNSEEIAWRGWERIEYLFVFGDSYADTGFDMYGRQPDKERPLGNSKGCQSDEDYPSCLPKTWPYFLTMTYNRSIIKTYNLAVGGATIDHDVVEPVLDFSTPFTLQARNKFVDGYCPPQESTPWQQENSLFAVMFGINDVLRSASSENDAPVKELIKSYKGSIAALHDSGARNFLLLATPPIDRTAMFDLLRSEKEQVKLAAREKESLARLNAEHATMCDELRSEYRDATIFRVDINKLFYDAIIDVARFEQTSMIKEITKTRVDCDLDEYGKPKAGARNCERSENEFFWSGLHPTYPVQNVTAAVIVDDCFADGKSPRRYCFLRG